VGAIFCPGCRSAIAADAPSCTACTLMRPQAGWPVDPQIGRVVQQKYRIDSRLSSGGFGTVFITMQVHGGIEMGRVILKFLHPEHAADPTVTKRFLNEVRTARELINPHIVRVFDLGYDDDGTPFMVQEFIEGEGLDQVLEREKRLNPAVAIKIAMQVAEGMAEAHRKQIVHRDLKPENLRIQKGTGIVKILDFGIARVATSRGTATNSFIGTPRYMPPEQIKQQKLDSGVDIFALGVITFEMLAGEPPIPHENSELEYIHLNLIQEPRPLRQLVSDCPTELSDFIHSMMEKDRPKRPPDMEAVAARLQEIAIRHNWADETTGKFRLTAPPSGGRGATVAIPTRDRTPSPATTHRDEEVIELVPSRPKRTGLWVGLVTAGIFLVAGAVVVLARGTGGGGGQAPSPLPAVSVPAVAIPPPVPALVDAGGPAAPVEAAARVIEAVASSPDDAGVPAPVPDAVAVIEVEEVKEPETAVAVADIGPDALLDAALAVKIEDVAADEARAPVADAATAAEAADARADQAAAVRDAGGRRDTGVVRPPRDAGGRAQDSGPARDAGAHDAGFQFTKVGGGGP